MDAPVVSNAVEKQILDSNFISRDLSWIQFNYRVLDQAKNSTRSVFDRLKFLSITASNLDEFCTIRVGSLYNYLDYGKERYDYSGLREIPFKDKLLSEIQHFERDQHATYLQQLKPLFSANNFCICDISKLSPEGREKVNEYFTKVIYPMLTPMVFDGYHAFPILKNNRLLLGVVTKAPQ